MDEMFLTVGEAARVLGKSPECVRLYERSGKLPALKTRGGVRLFRQADVDRLARQQSTDRATHAARAAT